MYSPYLWQHREPHIWSIEKIVQDCTIFLEPKCEPNRPNKKKKGLSHLRSKMPFNPTLGQSSQFRAISPTLRQKHFPSRRNSSVRGFAYVIKFQKQVGKCRKCR